MADNERLAAFIGVARSRVPTNPEGLEFPKQAMVNLARRSRHTVWPGVSLERPSPPGVGSDVHG